MLVHFFKEKGSKVVEGGENGFAHLDFPFV